MTGAVGNRCPEWESGQIYPKFVMSKAALEYGPRTESGTYEGPAVRVEGLARDVERLVLTQHAPVV